MQDHVTDYLRRQYECRVCQHRERIVFGRRMLFRRHQEHLQANVGFHVAQRPNFHFVYCIQFFDQHRFQHTVFIFSSEYSILISNIWQNKKILINNSLVKVFFFFNRSLKWIKFNSSTTSVLNNSILMKNILYIFFFKIYFTILNLRCLFLYNILVYLVKVIEKSRFIQFILMDKISFSLEK